MDADKKSLDTFIQLAEGQLSPGDWLLWFEQNKELVETICGRIVFLKTKPKSSSSDVRNTHYAQVAICNWLNSKNISFVQSDIYAQSEKKEFDDFCEKQQKKEKKLRQLVESKLGYLKDCFPKFYKQLLKSYHEGDHIEQGVVLSELEKKAQQLSITFPEDLTLFFKNISQLELEGLSISFEELGFVTQYGDKLLMLGEYWRYGDGDKLLYNLTTNNVFVLAHELRPPELIKQTNSIVEFVEKEIVKHLKLYEE